MEKECPIAWFSHNLQLLSKGEVEELAFPAEGFDEDEEVTIEEMVTEHVRNIEGAMGWCVTIAWTGHLQTQMEEAYERNKEMLARARNIRWDNQRMWVE